MTGAPREPFRRIRRRRFLAGLALAALGPRGAAADHDRAADAATLAIERGEAFLAGAQRAGGSWEDHLGITAVVLLALGRSPSGAPSAERAGRALAYVERWARPDGGIYQQEDIRHYTTAVGLLALAATGDETHRARIAAARDYLVGLQAREDNGFPAGHPLFGGILVGGGKANLDGTFFASRALAGAGLPRAHPFWARARRFVSRCQNWKATNDQPWAGTDGGFVFAPGFSFAGETRSYGTMTYAGVSAYHDAGVPGDDERVKAAFRWLDRNFTVDENPGLAQQTLYHSYFYLASTLTRVGADTLAGAQGRPRAWKRPLVEALLARQRPDGSWANPDPRWMESNPVLATAFAVRALKYAIDSPRG